MKIVLVLILFVKVSFVYSTSIAVLPVVYHNNQSSENTRADSKETSWELAKLIELQLQIGDIKAIVPTSIIKNYYKKNNLNAITQLNTEILSKIAYGVDTTQLLYFTITKKKNNYIVTSQQFHTFSKSLIDKIVSKHRFLIKAIDKNIQLIFNYYKLPDALRSNKEPSATRNLLIYEEAVGSNYKEIKKLHRFLPRIPNLNKIYLCAGNGVGQMFTTSHSIKKKRKYVTPIELPKALNKIHIQGHRINHASLISCMYSFLKDPNSDINLFLGLVSNKPTSVNLFSQIKNIFQKIQFSGFILKPSFLNSESISFWDSIAQQNTFLQSLFMEYHQQFGVHTGEEIDVYLKGTKLITYLNGDEKIYSLSRYQQHNFSYQKIASTFKDLSHYKILWNSGVNISFKKILAPLYTRCTDCNQQNSNTETISVLFKSNNIPFWIRIPKKIVIDKKFKLNQKYYFLFNLLKKSKSTPFTIQENFVSFHLGKNNISNLLLLDLKKYLKNPKKFLNKSIAGTSLYYLYGSIEKIRW